MSMFVQTLNVYYTCGELPMKLSELTTAVAGVSAQLVKVRDEILAKIAALEAALADVELPEDAVAAFNALRNNVQVLDDIMPDVVEAPVEPPTE